MFKAFFLIWTELWFWWIIYQVPSTRGSLPPMLSRLLVVSNLSLDWRHCKELFNAPIRYVQLYASNGKAETFPVFSWPGTNVTQDYYCCTNATQTPHVTLAAQHIEWGRCDGECLIAFLCLWIDAVTTISLLSSKSEMEKNYFCRISIPWKECKYIRRRFIWDENLNKCASDIRVRWWSENCKGATSSNKR